MAHFFYVAVDLVLKEQVLLQETELHFRYYTKTLFNCTQTTKEQISLHNPGWSALLLICGISGIKWVLSHKTLVILYSNNKGANQPAQPRLISAFVDLRHLRYKVSPITQNPCFVVLNKRADQPAQLCRLISTFVELINYVPVNNCSVKLRCFLDWQGIKCLAKEHNTVPCACLKPVTRSAPLFIAILKA